MARGTRWVGVSATQRGGEELEEGVECSPLVIGVKGHQVWWVDNKARSGCRGVDR
jgi:hypothetical protein